MNKITFKRASPNPRKSKPSSRTRKEDLLFQQRRHCRLKRFWCLSCRSDHSSF
uniref:Uncharacterized protein n=1 Tax=Helianthus annuus TaxID=4232 RepID=A0A251T8U2_HELAN